MNARLEAAQYGKSQVRVLKILRDGSTHTVKELAITLLLEGDFESSYTSGDNSKVVPTDTMKNTVYALAKEHLQLEKERFALILARHFVKKYAQVKQANITATERLWDRMQIEGQPHSHSFMQSSQAQPFTSVCYSEQGERVQSGIRGLLVLKSTGSGFTGYPRCEFTTLPETEDRIFATSLDATWDYSADPKAYNESNERIIEAMLSPFAMNYSPSVQTTLFEMGAAALAACGEINRIHLAMPNKHYLLFDLKPFGLENRNEVFVPTDEPHGQIEATVTR
jgi:urate oxidase